MLVLGMRLLTFLLKAGMFPQGTEGEGHVVWPRLRWKGREATGTFTPTHLPLTQAEGTTISPYPGQSQDNILIRGTQWGTRLFSLFSLELWLKAPRERGVIERGFQP